MKWQDGLNKYLGTRWKEWLGNKFPALTIPDVVRKALKTVENGSTEDERTLLAVRNLFDICLLMAQEMGEAVTNKSPLHGLRGIYDYWVSRDHLRPCTPDTLAARLTVVGKLPVEGINNTGIDSLLILLSTVYTVNGVGRRPYRMHKIRARIALVIRAHRMVVGEEASKEAATRLANAIKGQLD